MAKAIFLDRDGVINELVYFPEAGIIDSPFTVEQFRLLPGVPEAIKEFKGLGYKVILVSNQPGIAKKHLSRRTFENIRRRMQAVLANYGAELDAEYYCFHHPEARVKGLRMACDCRKPNPGLLLQATRDFDLVLSESWMVGDNLTDVQTGRAAGCKTILLGSVKCELCRRIDEEGKRPHVICGDLLQAVNAVKH